MSLVRENRTLQFISWLLIFSAVCLAICLSFPISLAKEFPSFLLTCFRSTELRAFSCFLTMEQIMNSVIFPVAMCNSTQTIGNQKSSSGSSSPESLLGLNQVNHIHCCPPGWHQSPHPKASHCWCDSKSPP